jgi:hypothetical protein
MKILSLLGLIALSSMSLAASVVDRDQLSTLASAQDSVGEIAPAVGGLLAVTSTPLESVSADGVMNPTQVVAAQSATSVPESAEAAFLALFGYILMLRRRTT